MFLFFIQKTYMMRLATALMLIFASLSLGLTSLPSEPPPLERVDAQDVDLILAQRYDSLVADLEVLNFWATWCKPCVAELPYFEALQEAHEPTRLRVRLLSLDFPNEIERKLLPFIEKNIQHSQVLVMTDTDYDAWMGKIDEDWSGNIPATLFFNHQKGIYHFVSGELDKQTLFAIADSLLAEN
jgi:thiol-disulfide isomerase/thioredoxin